MQLTFVNLLRNLIRSNQPIIDGTTFRLHYKYTLRLLIVFGLIVMIREYHSDSIDCIIHQDIDYPSDLVNTFCWTQERFYIPKTNQVNDSTIMNNRQIYFNNFHWFGFVLFIQGLLFYIPHCLWIYLENNKIQSLLSDINNESVPDEKKQDQKQLLIRYLVTNLHKQQFYAFKYVSIELINFINVIVQIAVSNAFINGSFLGLGFYLFAPQDKSSSIYSNIFPRSAICQFQTLTKEGIKLNEVVCLLPINLILEKILICLWFWFIGLTLISAFGLIKQILYYSSFRIRLYSIYCDAHLCDFDQLNRVIRKCQFGDWFILKLINKNLNAIDFRELIAGLAKKHINDQPLITENDI